MYKPHVEQGLRQLKKLPYGIECSTCVLSGDCDQYTEGAVCAYNESFQALQVRDADTHVAIASWLAQVDLERTQRAVMQEATLAGGQIDPRVSAQIRQSFDSLDRFREIARIGQIEPPSFHASVTMRGGQEPGVLSRLFGGGATYSEMPNDPVRGPVIDVEQE